MAEPTILDRTYSFIMECMIKTGQAPHYTEIGAALGLTPPRARKTLRRLFSIPGFAGWLYPKTDAIVSFAPFNNLPTHYRISIDGEQKWFGQWAFESLAVSWLFPGKTVRIDSVCLDCGEPVGVTVKDGKILSAEPGGVIGHVSVPIGRWVINIPYSWSTMNFFRSEEHLKRWEGYAPGKEGGTIALSSLMWFFSGPYFQGRRDPDYVSRYGELLAGMMAKLDDLTEAGGYWRLNTLEKTAFTLGRKLKIL